MIVGDLKGVDRKSQGRVPAVAAEFAVQLSSREVPLATYQSFEQTPVVARQRGPACRPSWLLRFKLRGHPLPFHEICRAKVPRGHRQVKFVAPRFLVDTAKLNSSRQGPSWTPPS